MPVPPIQASSLIPHSSSLALLFRLDASRTRDLDPFLDLGLVEFRVFLGCVAHRFGALAREIVPDGRLGKRLDQRAVYAVYGGPRRAGRRHQAEAARNHETGNA